MTHQIGDSVECGGRTGRIEAISDTHIRVIFPDTSSISVPKTAAGSKISAASGDTGPGAPDGPDSDGEAT